MDARIRIRIGSLELEYEGPKDFLPKTMSQALAEFRQVAQDPAMKLDQDEEDRKPPPGGGGASSTSAIARKLGCGSGRDLLKAACVKLQVVDSKGECQRKDILAEMRTAKTYYKKSYQNNLSSYLERMVKDGELNEVGTDSYCMPEELAASLREQIG